MPDTTSKERRITPSEFMRLLRPEYYSDTEDHTTYQLANTTLEYHLDTITARNQTHELEQGDFLGA